MCVHMQKQNFIKIYIHVCLFMIQVALGFLTWILALFVCIALIFFFHSSWWKFIFSFKKYMK